MKVSGLMIKPRDSEYTLILMVQDMKANGFKISNMEWVLNNGQMVQSMKVFMTKA